MRTLIDGATVITMDGDERIIPDGAVLIADGRITDIGDSASVHARADGMPIDRTIDARGKVVLPGFVSVHNHLGYSVFRGRAEDIGHTAVQSLYVPMSTILAREERGALAALSTAELLRGGVTTVLQMEEDADVTAPFVEQSGIRALLGIMAHDIDVDALNRGNTVFDDRVRAQQLEQAVTFAEHINGRADGRLRAVMAINTLSTSSTDLMRELRDTADRLDIPVSLHLGIGEQDEVRKVHNGADAFQLAHDSGFLDDRAVAVHCYMVDDDDIALMARSGAALAHCPLMNQFRGCIAPAEAMRAAGIDIGLGIDNYFSDHFDVLRACIAVARIRANNPSVAPSAEILARATIGSARVLGLDAEIGSLETGKKADLQIVDARRYGLTPLNDPVRTLVYHAHAKDIDLVMVDGRIVVEDGRVTAVDEDDLIRRAEAAGTAAWARFADQHGGYAVPH
ncbi:MAG: amidohydrolase family protein [Rhodospirillales bacterium]|nr:amidohydrolase family protein [Rhodospirillales bacterium]MBO6786867.1 amidohydrolase family protein [Rhodospirillales bacterium]